MDTKTRRAATTTCSPMAQPTQAMGPALELPPDVEARIVSALVEAVVADIRADVGKES